MAERQSLVAQTTFLLKVLCLRMQRGIQNLLRPVQRWPRTAAPFHGERIEIRSPLFVDGRPEEREYELGKVANLRAALRHLNGIEIPAGEIFSFWRQLGHATAGRGFVPGRMLQLGCVVPAIGGGLCQLSNSLYQLALLTGCEIIERHPHSNRLPGTPLQDATIAWNYIDLRFRTPGKMRIALSLTNTELITTFVCENTPLHLQGPALQVMHPAQEPALVTCATCNQTACSRHEPLLDRSLPTTAFLVDTFWPEVDRYIQQARRDGDWLLLPIDGKRWHLNQYAWSVTGFRQVKAQVAQTLTRSLTMRRLASQGAARQTALLKTSADVAIAMAGQLPYQAGHIVVDQTLLPALWQSGALGGRTFDVILRRLPMKHLHDRLDAVAARWPQSPTAADFRANQSLVEQESEALHAANRLITPHQELASLFPHRTVILDWDQPAPGFYALQTDAATPRIYYPGPTTARKGAYLLREALENLPVELLYSGDDLEGPAFWDPCNAHRSSPPGAGIMALVQPAFLQDQPRALLKALASGIPVIGTKACGLGNRAGFYSIETEDASALHEAIKSVLQM